MGFNIGDDSLVVAGFDMGDDELGADELYFGGPPAASRKPNVARLAQPGVQTQVLPFPRGEAGAVTVAAGVTATVSARPQRVFQTQRLAWASTTSAFFVITQLTIGVNNMFVQAGVVPAEVFSQTGVGVSLSGYIAQPGIDVTLQAQNIDAAPHPILASIIGATMV